MSKQQVHVLAVSGAVLFGITRWVDWLCCPCSEGWWRRMIMKESSFVDAGVLLRTCEHCSFQTEMLPRTFCSCFFVFGWLAWLSDDLGPLVNCTLQTCPCGSKNTTHVHDSISTTQLFVVKIAPLVLVTSCCALPRFLRRILQKILFFRSDKFNHTGNTWRIKLWIESPWHLF